METSASGGVPAAEDSGLSNKVGSKWYPWDSTCTFIFLSLNLCWRSCILVSGGSLFLASFHYYHQVFHYRTAARVSQPPEEVRLELEG